MHRRTLLALLAGAPLFALPGSPTPPVAAAGSVGVTKATATPDVPQGITFHLEAQAQNAEIIDLWLLYHPTVDPVTRRVSVPIERGSRLTLDHLLDTQVPFLPPGVDVEYRWLFVLDDGTQVRSPAQTLMYIDSRMQWQHLSSGAVTLWWYRGDASFGAQVLDTATRSLATLTKTYNVPQDRPVRILVYGNVRDLQEALPPNSPDWLGGISNPELGLINVAVDLDSIGAATSVGAELGRVIPHEISRLVTYTASQNLYGTLPTWLDEGLAITAQETADVRLRPILYDATVSGKLIPVRALSSPFPLDVNQALLSYAESESIVKYIVNAYKPGTITALVAAFKDGISVEDAAQRVLKVSIDQLDQDWKDSLNYGGDQGGITG
jgi:hypothetical protein